MKRATDENLSIIVEVVVDRVVFVDLRQRGGEKDALLGGNDPVIAPPPLIKPVAAVAWRTGA